MKLGSEIRLTALGVFERFIRLHSKTLNEDYAEMDRDGKARELEDKLTLYIVTCIHLAAKLHSSAKTQMAKKLEAVFGERITLKRVVECEAMVLGVVGFSIMQDRTSLLIDSLFIVLTQGNENMKSQLEKLRELCDILYELTVHCKPGEPVQELRQLPDACAIGVLGAAVYLTGNEPQAPADLLDTLGQAAMLDADIVTESITIILQHVGAQMADMISSSSQS